LDDGRTAQVSGIDERAFHAVHGCDHGAATTTGTAGRLLVLLVAGTTMVLLLALP
jgi:hypothetical protein